MAAVSTRAVVVSGLGAVGAALLALFDERAADIAARYRLRFEVVAAVDSGGGALSFGGLPPARLRDTKAEGRSVATLHDVGRPGAAVPELLDELTAAGRPADLLVEAGPGMLSDGGPGLEGAHAALLRGMGVVFANKAPLVVDWAGLTGWQDAPRRGRGAVRYSACVGASLPTVALARELAVSATVTRIEAVLNSTCQRVLGEMENGHTLIEAVGVAQAQGFAEPDPSTDIDGIDTAVKLVILVAALGHSVALDDVDRSGLRDLSTTWVAGQQAVNRRAVLLGVAEPGRGNGRWRLKVRPEALDLDHPLARMSRAESGVVVHTDIAGAISASGRFEDVTPTAAAVLRDLIALADRENQA